MAASMWMPGAERLTPKSPGGTPLQDGPPRVVWHTTESGTGDAAFLGVHRWLASQGTEPTLLWDPTTGRIGQYFPANRSGRALRNDGTDRTNRTGRITIQIETLGRAANAPLKNGPCIGLEKILAWLDSLGIERTWPAGYPLPANKAYGLTNGDRSRTIWRTRGGHFGHSQVPNNDHADPGLIDPARFEKKKIVVKQEGWPVSVLKRGAFVTWWNSYSGKPDPKDIQTVAVDGKWHDVTGVHVDAAAVAGEEKHVLYLRCHPKWNSASTDGLYTEVRWLRDGGTPKDPKDDDATAYTPLYIPRFVDSFPWPALHLESGQAKVGGKWQVRFVGGASTVELLTRYAKTHVIAPSD